MQRIKWTKAEPVFGFARDRAMLAKPDGSEVEVFRLHSARKVRGYQLHSTTYDTLTELLDAVRGQPNLISVTITEDEYLEHCDGMDGVCLACGEWTCGDCEPDARNYPCDACDARQVFGAEEALTMGRLIIDGEA